MKKIRSVKPLDGYRLELVYDDGVQGVVDLSAMVGKGVFAVWSNPTVFASVRIGASGDLAWGDDIDLCPDSLYLKITNKRVEDLFPLLREDPVHA